MNGDTIRMAVWPATGSAIEVDAIPTVTLGLCVVADPYVPGAFCVVHFLSGLATFQHLPSLASAHEVAELLGQIGDWDRSFADEWEEMETAIAALPALGRFLPYWINNYREDKGRRDINDASVGRVLEAR